MRIDISYNHLWKTGIPLGHECRDCIYDSRNYAFCATHCTLMGIAANRTMTDKFTEIVVQEVE